MTTTSRTNPEVALRSLELISLGDSGPAVDELVHAEAVNHPRPGDTRGPDGLRQVVRWLNATFADIAITPQDVIEQDDKVVVRTRFSGLHVGPYMGIAPTRRTIEFDQIHVFRLEDGLVAEHWACMDELSALRQMGVAVP